MVKTPRCGCSGVCNCLIEGVDTDCINITITGNGTPAVPYVISAIPVIDPVTGNQLSCGASGLLVPAAEGTFITVLDTDCIDMTITGDGSLGDPYVISSIPVVDPVTGNQLSCGVDGLFVPASSEGVTIRKNTGADVGTRPRLNLIEGANITLTVVDDAGSNEVDITIASSGGAGAADETLFWTLAAGI